MKHYLFPLFICASLGLTAQTTKDTLQTQSIYILQKVGLSWDVIKSKIASSPCNFDLSTSSLVQLKQSGVPDDVITLMLQKDQVNTSQIRTTATKEQANYSDGKLLNGVSKIEPGIYYYKNLGDKLIQLEPIAYSQTKKGSGILGELTGGIALTKTISKLSGAAANLQIFSNKNPFFMFYFDKDISNSFATTNVWTSAGHSPNEFILVKFRCNKKSRDVVTGSYGSYVGFSSGISDNDKISFKYEKLTSGQYRIYFNESLKAGEYGFMFASGETYLLGTYQKVYDFGIN